MTPLAAYLLLFVAVGVGFIFVHLVAGKLIRPSKPDAEKGTIYECGEPTIGSAWIQFDLRFYVVALLFVIFDVEVAFFFPWAEVFGKANAIANAPKPTTPEEYRAYADVVLDLAIPAGSSGSTPGKQHLAEIERYKKMRRLTDQELDDMREEQAKMREKLKTAWDKITPEDAKVLQFDGALKGGMRRNAAGELEPYGEFEKNRVAAVSLARLALIEVLVFFGVLLVGFAYLWRRGDLAWVRSTAAERPELAESATPPPPAAPVRPAAADTKVPVGADGRH
jgi:NADH:ubiquinone oxidoreductase subunit 3 (subunit A)